MGTRHVGACCGTECTRRACLEPRRTVCAAAKAHGLQEAAHKQRCHAAGALCHGPGGSSQVLCRIGSCSPFPRVLCDTTEFYSHAVT